MAASFVAAAAAAPPPLRIAVSDKLPPGLFGRLATGQRTAWERTASLLSATGHEIVERDHDYGLGAEDVLSSLAGRLEQAALWAARRPPGF